MAAGGVIGVIAALAAALPHSGAFNIHPAPYRILTHGGSSSFGHQVLHLGGDRLLVGAPVGPGGRLFQCRVEAGECTELELGANSSRSHVGMALSRWGDDVIACGPGWRRRCPRTDQSGGVCVTLGPGLRETGTRWPGERGCQQGLVDLVFLLDGSSSMTPSQFGAIRDFVAEVMEQLENSSIHFAAVQFSSRIQPCFSLADYAANPRPRELLRGLKQLGGLTDTFTAIKYVVHQTFSPALGSRPGARRVLIIITDGDATDGDNGSVRDAEERRILRYVIGIGTNFAGPASRRHLGQFASRPGRRFVRVLENFHKLRGLFQEIQAKIYDIEGTSDLNRFHLELSCSGMSVAVLHGRVVAGAVGADNWAGGLLDMDGTNETFVANPELARNGTDAYLGYSLATLHVPNRTLVAAGAPRHRHLGAVVLFDVPKAPGPWRHLQTLPGEQVGSYFGASLLALEPKGGTVALLVGVPHYYDGRRGGRVLVYRWREPTLELNSELIGSPGHPLGGFGASLGTLGDIDGDERPEVAVGAPNEDEGAGALYVFMGAPGGVTTSYSQRLEGRRVAPGLAMFGISVAGTFGDGNGDVAVGTRGHVVLLRSRPVLHVTPSVTFDPPLVPSSRVDCSEVTGVIVTVGICLTPRPGDPVTPVHFLLEAEPERARGRGLLGAGRERGVAGRLLLGAGPACTGLPLELPPCLDDPVTPVRLRLQLIGPEGAPPTPVLPPRPRPLWAEVPIERSCGADAECRADLWVRALPAPPALWGALGGALGLRLLLGNGAEDAYGAALQVTAPVGLGLRRARAARASTPVPISCDLSAVGQPWGLSCNISRPIFRAGWEVEVELTFDMAPNASWGESVGLKALVSSDNEPHGTLGDNEAKWDVPIRYALRIVATWEDGSTPYINFTSNGPRNKSLEHRYRIELLQPLPPGPAPQVTAWVLLPHTLPHGISMRDPQVRVEPLGGACGAVGQEEEGAVGQELRGLLEEGCPAPRLRLFRCPPAPPPARVLIGSALEAPPTIAGPAHFRLCSALALSLAAGRFEAPPPGLRAQGMTSLELLPLWAPWAGLLGGGAGGLLLLLLIGCGLRQCGFFRRNFRERLEEREGPEEDGEGPEVEGGSPEVDGQEMEEPEGEEEAPEVEEPGGDPQEEETPP